MYEENKTKRRRGRPEKDVPSKEVRLKIEAHDHQELMKMAVQSGLSFNVFIRKQLQQTARRRFPIKTPDKTNEGCGKSYLAIFEDTTVITGSHLPEGYEGDIESGCMDYIEITNPRKPQRINSDGTMSDIKQME